VTRLKRNQRVVKEGATREFLDPHVLARLSRLSVLARGLVEGTFSGRHRSPHRGSSVEFAQYRKYVPGDDVKTFDWKVYAKTDRYYVKEFEADTNLRCYLVLDCSGSMLYDGGRGNKADYARRLAATLAHLLVKQGDAVGLLCFAERVVRDVPPRASPKHLRNIFDVLAEMRPAGRTHVVRILHDLAERIRRRALVIVFSDLLTDVEPLLDCFHHLHFRKHDLAVFHLMDDAELEFRFDRPIRFADLESSFKLVAEPIGVRQAYLRSLAAYTERLRTGCREFRVDYRLVRMSRSYEDVLSEFLLDRQRTGVRRR